MELEHLDEFDRDLKHLLKKFRTLKDDLETLRKYLSVSPHASPPTSFLISCIAEKYEIVKVKKFACKALKGRGANSGIRIIYAFHKDENKIVFIEIYFKADRKIEDRERIKRYYF